MILYYAPGGGLGHLTRAFALAGGLLKKGDGPVRIMATSRHARAALSAAPCPVDIPDSAVLATLSGYQAYLSDYLKRYQVEAVVLDTFPFGIIGEWSALAPKLPRVLIARYLKWAAYQERVGDNRGPYPSRCLMIEDLEEDCLSRLQVYGTVDSLGRAISFPGPVCRKESKERGREGQQWLILHTGDLKEREALVAAAYRFMEETGSTAGKPVMLFPEQEVYPAHELLDSCTYVVSAGGYNCVCQAHLAPAGRVHFLHPFDRRYDDQHLRCRRFKAQTWQKDRIDGTGRAVQWIIDALRDVRGRDGG